MKTMKIITTFLLFSIYIPSILGQSKEKITLKFNRMEHFAPADRFSSASMETFKHNSYITIDLNENTYTILIYWDDGPIEHVYTIDRISELQPSEGKGRYFTITCYASNYAKVYIDLHEKGDWVKDTTVHNGIYRLFYNY